eukprot:TRINITY_DN2677_c1_g2_i2.p3 TRINITY_DN2677_c1_g2~~TRINITY_DN2677_c1_g2_i2.p3  ORF type:complete len:186 (-),score=-23.97 TRINITY_DN2677_c1_g2_i2:952-1509(-)
MFLVSISNYLYVYISICTLNFLCWIQFLLLHAINVSQNQKGYTQRCSQHFAIQMHYKHQIYPSSNFLYIQKVYLYACMAHYQYLNKHIQMQRFIYCICLYDGSCTYDACCAYLSYVHVVHVQHTGQANCLQGEYERMNESGVASYYSFYQKTDWKFFSIQDFQLFCCWDFTICSCVIKKIFQYYY